MRTFWILIAVILFADPSRASEYISVTLEKPIDRSADAAWAKIGSFCAVKDIFKFTCEYVTGNGDIGTVRKVADGRALEVMVGKTEHSYTFAFPQPNPIMFHGTIGVVPVTTDKSKAVFTLFWDQESLATPEAKASDKASRTALITRALNEMKILAEVR